MPAQGVLDAHHPADGVGAEGGRAAQGIGDAGQIATVVGEGGGQRGGAVVALQGLELTGGGVGEVGVVGQRVLDAGELAEAMVVQRRRAALEGAASAATAGGVGMEDRGGVSQVAGKR